MLCIYVDSPIKPVDSIAQPRVIVLADSIPYNLGPLQRRLLLSVVLQRVLQFRQLLLQPFYGEIVHCQLVWL